MSESEQIVYSEMGLDPILLLENPPSSEKYTVRIIKSGEKGDGDNNKNLILENNNPIEQDTINLEEIKNKKEEENEETNLDVEEERNNLISSEKITINETNELNLTESKEADEDPRRKRRRSSAAAY